MNFFSLPGSRISHIPCARFGGTFGGGGLHLLAEFLHFALCFFNSIRGQRARGVNRSSRFIGSVGRNFSRETARDRERLRLSHRHRQKGR